MSLREEYQQEKQRKDVIVTKAARGWVEANVVLINEQIDRRTVKRLIDSISKFDEVFGPYKDKIPALAAQIDVAEQGLQKVVTGQANEKKAADMLKRLSFLYSTFSRFFNQDLPVLLKSHMFKSPKANPQTRLDVLQPKTGESYDPTAIRDMLRHALAPSKDDLKLLSKIYGKRKVPLVDALQVANQMLHMSYNELESLTGMEKVPMVATDAAEEPVVPEAPRQAGGVVAVTTGESVNRTQKKELVLESHTLLKEINQTNMTQLVDIINQLQQSFDISGMERVSQSLENVISSARKELASNTWMQGKAAKQLLGFYNLMDNLNQQWPEIQQLFGDGQLSVQDESDLKRLLQSATKDSVFARMARAVKLGTPHAPGLDPNSVANALVTAAQQEGGIEAVSALFNRSKGMPGTTTEGEPKLGGQAQGTEPTTQAAGAAAASPADKPAETATTQSTEPRGGADEPDMNTMVADLADKTKMDPGALKNLLDNFGKHNYKLVPA